VSRGGELKSVDQHVYGLSFTVLIVLVCYTLVILIFKHNVNYIISCI